MFNLWAMSSASLLSFVGALALRGSIIGCSISDGPFIGPQCSTTIDLSSVFPLFEVGFSATRMVLPFRRTVVH